MPSLNELLGYAYSGGGTLGSLGRGGALVDPYSDLFRQKQQRFIPPATQDLPDPTVLDNLFAKTAVQNAIEGTEPDANIGTKLWHGVGHVIDALSAGEYAIANMLKASSRGEDAWEGFWNGLRAGFSDDEQFKTRMYDVLTEWGWNPETTGGKIGKTVVGFLTGMLVDPLSYIPGPGILAKNLGSFVGKKAIKEVMQDMGIVSTGKVLKNMAGGQAFNARGRKIIEKLKEAHGVPTVLTGPLDIRATQTAESLAVKDALRAFIPMPEHTLDEAIAKKTVTIGDKQVNLLEFVLEAEGKQATRTNMKKLNEEGFAEFFDPGGFKIGIPFTQHETHLFKQAGILGPRSSGFLGMFMGHLIGTNTPLTYKVIDALSKKKIEGAFDSVTNELKKKFVAKADLSEDEQMGFQQINAMEHMNQTLPKIIGESLVHTDPKYETKSFGRIEMAVPKPGTDRLTDAEDKFAQALGWDLNYRDKFRTMQENGISIPEIVRIALRKRPDDELIAHAKELGVDLSAQNVERIAKVTSGDAKWFNTSFRKEKEAGYEYEQLKAYFPMIAGERADQFIINTGRTQVVVPKEELMKKLLGKSWKEINSIPLGIGGMNIAVKPVQRLSETIAGRAKSTITKINLQQFFEQNMYNLRVIQSFNDPKFRKMIEETGILKSNPQLAFQLGQVSHRYRAGVPTGHDIKPEEGVYDAMRGLIRAETPAEVAERLQRSLDTIKIIDRTTYEGIEAEYERAINHWRKELQEGQKYGARATTHAADILSALQKQRKDFLDKVYYKVLNNVMYANVAKAGQQAAKAQSLYGRLDQFRADIRNKLGKEAEGQLQPLLESVGITDNLGSVTEEAVMQLESMLYGRNELKMMWRRAKGTTLSEFEKKFGTAGARPDRLIEEMLRPVQEEARVPLEKFANIRVPHPFLKDKWVPLSHFSLDRSYYQAIANVVDPEIMLRNAPGEFSRLVSFVSNPLKRFLTGTMVPFLNIFRPAFVGRNVLDNQLRAALESTAAGYSPKAGQIAYQILRGEGMDGVVGLGGKKYTKKVLQQLLESSGQGVTGLEKIGARGTFGEYLLSHEFTEKAGYKWNDWMRSLKKSWYGKAQAYVDPDKWNFYADNFSRYEKMIAMLDRGMPMAQIQKRMSRSLFDYHNLTPFEKSIAPFIFFYNYQRQAVPYALEQLYRRPLWFNVGTRLSDLAFDDQEEQAAAPKWIKDYPLISLGKENGKLKLMSFRNMFSVDMLGDFNPLSAKAWLEKLNPILAVVPELAVGKDFYMGTDILPVKKLKEERSKLVNSAWNPFFNYVKGRWVTAADGKEYMAVDGERWHIMQRLFFSRLYRDMDSFGKMIEGQNDIWQSMMNFGLGLKVIEFDIEKQKEFLKMEASKMKSKYNDALRSGDRQRAIEILKQLRI